MPTDTENTEEVSSIITTGSVAKTLARARKIVNSDKKPTFFSREANTNSYKGESKRVIPLLDLATVKKQLEASNVKKKLGNGN